QGQVRDDLLLVRGHAPWLDLLLRDDQDRGRAGRLLLRDGGRRREQEQGERGPGASSTHVRLLSLLRAVRERDPGPKKRVHEVTVSVAVGEVGPIGARVGDGFKRRGRHTGCPWGPRAPTLHPAITGRRRHVPRRQAPRDSRAPVFPTRPRPSGWGQTGVPAVRR